MSISLKILTPEKVLFKADSVESIGLPSDQGSFQIYNNHAPIVSQLDKGVVVVEESANKTTFEINGGFVDFKNNQAVILAG